jgi:hypothetical protein
MEQKRIGRLPYHLDPGGFAQQAAEKRVAGLGGEHQTVKAADRADGGGNRKFFQHQGPRKPVNCLIVRQFVRYSQRCAELLGEVPSRCVLKKLITQATGLPNDYLHGS